MADKENSNNPNTNPLDKRVVLAMMREMGITEYDPRTVKMLTDFAYSYATNVLIEAKTNNPNKKELDSHDIQSAILSNSESVAGPLERGGIMKYASLTNRTPLPIHAPDAGLRLPSDSNRQYFLSYPNRSVNVAGNKASAKPATITSGSLPEIDLSLGPKRNPTVAQQTEANPKPKRKISSPTIGTSGSKSKVQVTPNVQLGSIPDAEGKQAMTKIIKEKKREKDSAAVVPKNKGAMAKSKKKRSPRTLPAADGSQIEAEPTTNKKGQEQSAATGSSGEQAPMKQAPVEAKKTGAIPKRKMKRSTAVPEISVFEPETQPTASKGKQIEIQPIIERNQGEESDAAGSLGMKSTTKLKIQETSNVQLVPRTFEKGTQTEIELIIKTTTYPEIQGTSNVQLVPRTFEKGTQTQLITLENGEKESAATLNIDTGSMITPTKPKIQGTSDVQLVPPTAEKGTQTEIELIIKTTTKPDIGETPNVQLVPPTAEIGTQTELITE